jgi:hypothetical protein
MRMPYGVWRMAWQQQQQQQQQISLPCFLLYALCHLACTYTTSASPGLWPLAVWQRSGLAGCWLLLLAQCCLWLHARADLLGAAFWLAGWG